MSLLESIKNHGAILSMSFAGKDVEQIGEILGGENRPKDKIVVYRLTDKKSNEISWCINVITKSRMFHGTGRIAGEIPLNFNQEEMRNILTTFSDHRF